jgi:hypothetical protein
MRWFTGCDPQPSIRLTVEASTRAIRASSWYDSGGDRTCGHSLWLGSPGRSTLDGAYSHGNAGYPPGAATSLLVGV